jgi:hypothetical protein
MERERVTESERERGGGERGRERIEGGRRGGEREKERERGVSEKER